MIAEKLAASVWGSRLFAQLKNVQAVVTGQQGSPREVTVNVKERLLRCAWR